MGPEVGPAFQRRCRRPPLVNSWRPVGWNGVQALSQFSQFVTGGRKIPGHSGLRAVIRTAPGARSGRANDTDGIWETERERDSKQVGQVRCWGGPRRGGLWKNSATSMLALDVVRETTAKPLRTTANPSGSQFLCILILFLQWVVDRWKTTVNPLPTGLPSILQHLPLRVGVPPPACGRTSPCVWTYLRLL
eukprot:gene14595-biopygen8113